MNERARSGVRLAGIGVLTGLLNWVRPAHEHMSSIK